MKDEAKELIIKAIEKMIDNKPIRLSEKLIQKKRLHQAKYMANNCEFVLQLLLPGLKNINLPVALINNTIDYITSINELENKKIDKLIKIFHLMEEAYYKRDSSKLIRFLNKFMDNC